MGRLTLVVGDSADIREALRDIMGGARESVARESGVSVCAVPAAAAAPAAPAPPAAPSHDAAEGGDVLAQLVRDWMHNFEVKDAPQPPRDERLMAAFAGYGRPITAFCREKGGLANAVIDCLLRGSLARPEEAVQLGKRVALNMMQVGTALALPIDGLIERSMYHSKEAQTDGTKPFGGMAMDVIGEEPTSPRLKPPEYRSH